MPDDELYAPALYSGWWAALGVVIVLLVVAWVVLAFRSTRASAEEKALRFRPSWATGALDPYAGLRTEFEAHLDAVEAAYLAGGLDERGLHLALSKEVRGFASGRLGMDASVLTLSEIERMTGTAHLTRLIARYYHPSFAEDEALDASSRPGPGGSPDGRESINRARSVVRTW
ncbi:hypothetical protein [Oerskovia paurometabola]|uniref:hypothetical protein n=1 Tax=Oerskovia paurometabola TaxID=162170 RepID=UPI0037F92C34